MSAVFGRYTESHKFAVLSHKTYDTLRIRNGSDYDMMTVLWILREGSMRPKHLFALFFLLVYIAVIGCSPSIDERTITAEAFEFTEACYEIGG